MNIFLRINQLWTQLKQLVQKGFQSSPLMVVSIANAVVMVLGTGTSFILVRALTKENYGHLIYFYSCAALLRLVMNLGLMANMGRDVSVAWNDPERLKTVIYSNAATRVVAMFVFSAIALTIAAATNQPFWEYIVVAAIAASSADFFQSIIASSRQTSALVTATIVQPLVYLVLSLGLVAFNLVTSNLLMVTYIASFFAMMLVAFYFVIRNGKIGLPSRVSFNFQYLKHNISFTMLAFMSGMFYQLWSTVALGVLGWMSLFQASAEFSVIFTTAGLPVSIVSTALLTTFYPQMAVLFHQNQPHPIRVNIESVMKLIVLFAVWVGIVLLAFPETIVTTLFGASYLSSAPYLTRFAILPLFQSLAPVFTLSLLASKKPTRSLYGGMVQLLTLVVILTAFPLSLEVLSWAVLVSCIASVTVQWIVVSLTLRTVIIPPGIFSTFLIAVVAVFVMKWFSSLVGVRLSLSHVLIITSFSAVYWFIAFLQRNFHSHQLSQDKA